MFCDRARRSPRPRVNAAACYALASGTATLAVTGLALRLLSDFSATRRYVADASYRHYIIHLPLVALLQTSSRGSAGPGR